jgi:hypothetical protein
MMILNMSVNDVAMKNISARGPITGREDCGTQKATNSGNTVAVLQEFYKTDKFRTE